MVVQTRKASGYIKARYIRGARATIKHLVGMRRDSARVGRACSTNERQIQQSQHRRCLLLHITTRASSEQPKFYVVAIDQVTGSIYCKFDKDAIPGEFYLKICERASEFDCTYRRRMA